MTLDSGTKLGAYEVLAPLGAGGMGEVYRATDSRLGRTVAVKVLPAELAHDAERLARFEREARLLASLSHPHVAHVYGFESTELPDGSTRPVLAMELVEGETLAERLSRGPLPLRDALATFVQIAEGLEAAHASGIVHRDLKPANVKIDESGRARILDFGLAKAMIPEAAESPDASASPTLSFAATQHGQLLGTAAYMSPEQARGKPVDARTDVWALGVCLYEALTGRRPFTAEDAPGTLAKILETEPDPAALAHVPPAVRMIVRRCLRKDPAQRTHAVADVRIALQECLDGSLSMDGEKPARSRLAAALPWGLTAVIALLGAALLLRPPAGGTGLVPPLQHVTIELPRSATSLVPVLSPDGRHLSYTGVSDTGDWQLFLRPLAEPEPHPVEGTSKGEYQFFSSDSQWIAFHAQGELRKVPLAGGFPVVICRIPELIGGTWGPEDDIVFGQPNEGLYRVSSSGGAPVRLTDPAEDGAVGHTWPRFLPGSDSLLYTVWRGSDVDTQVAMLSLSDGSSRILTDGAGARYASSGHLVFRRGESLMAQRFDLTSGTVVGEAVEMVRPVGGFLGGASFALSPAGQLFHYASNVAVLGSTTLKVVDRTGLATPLRADAAPGWNQPRISPSGRQLAYADVLAWSIRSVDLQSGRSVPIIRGAAGQVSSWPVWSPDGEWVAFTSSLAGGFNTFRARADGAGAAERLTFEPTFRTIPSSWSIHDVLAIEQGTNNVRSLFMLRMADEEERELQPFLVTRFNERGARFSPDGDWVAFTSDRSGQDEVWVVAYPDPGVPIPISIGGGREPAWSRDGRELFYRRGDEMWRVPVATGRDGFRPGQPEVLFLGRYTYGYIDWASNYDVAPDGRFFMVEEAPPPPLHVVIGWGAELERRLPPD